MKVLIGRRVEGHVRLVGRIVRVVLVAAAMLAGSAQPASAQFIEFMEWLDRLSGPGEFVTKVPGIGIPIVCLSKVTKKEEFTTVAAIQAARSAGTLQAIRDKPEIQRMDLGFLPECLGIISRIRSRGGQPLWGADPKDEAVLRKQQLLSLDFTFSKLMSVNNELEGYPAGLDDDGDDKQVNITQYGFGVRFLPHPAGYVRLALDRYEFSSASGTLFNSFDREAMSLEVGARPFYRWGGKYLDPITTTISIKYGLGRFTAADFGATGTFNVVDDQLPSFKVSYDLWNDKCWLGLCR